MGSEARVLGEVALVVDGAPVAVGGPAPRAVFAMLALEAGAVVSRDRLVDGLWGDRLPPNPDGNLQTHVSRLRRALAAAGAGQVVVTRPSGYCLDLAGRVDLHRFDAAARSGRAALAGGQPVEAVTRLRAALACWTGPPLGGVDEFPFAAPAIARLAEARLGVIEDLHDALLATGEGPALVAELRQVVDEHPLRERLRGQLVRALYHGGRQADALEELRRFAAHLDDELGLEPSPALRDLERAILTHEVPEPTHPGRSPDPGPPSHPGPPSDPGPVPPRGLPAALDSFVGRRSEIELIEARLADPTARLISLTGPGGSGKTRLAEEVARRWASTAGGRAIVVRLDPITDLAQIVTAIAGTLGLNASSTTDAIAHVLSDGRSLLVLDNCEHLLDGVDVIGDLLSAASQTTVLATSRVTLHLPGEHEITVPPLRLPPAEATGARAVSDATELFVDRARARTAEFDPEAADRTAIARLVRLLDGLPLAIELAAARTKVLSPAEMLERMRGPLDLVSDPGRRRVDRQQTLRATVRWSVDLLGDDLRHAFARLSTFAGRFDLDDAAAVIGDDLGVDPLDGRWADVEAHAESARVASEVDPDADLPAVARMNYRTDALMTSGDWEGAADTARAVLDLLGERISDLA